MKNDSTTSGVTFRSQEKHQGKSQPSHPGLGSISPVTSTRLRVNGRDYTLEIKPWTTLLDALREYTDLTGTKKGCDHGQCGACTVLVDGKRINSCLTLAVMHEDHEITTIEGLGTEQDLHPIQEAFIEHDAFQCGYCTPGQICSAVGLFNEGRLNASGLSQDQLKDLIREQMSGNVCRCGAYANIVAAIEDVHGQDVAREFKDGLSRKERAQ